MLDERRYYKGKVKFRRGGSHINQNNLLQRSALEWSGSLFQHFVLGSQFGHDQKVNWLLTSLMDVSGFPECKTLLDRFQLYDGSHGTGEAQKTNSRKESPRALRTPVTVSRDIWRRNWCTGPGPQVLYVDNADSEENLSWLGVYSPVFRCLRSKNLWRRMNKAKRICFGRCTVPRTQLMVPPFQPINTWMNKVDEYPERICHVCRVSTSNVQAMRDDEKSLETGGAVLRRVRKPSASSSHFADKH